MKKELHALANHKVSSMKYLNYEKKGEGNTQSKAKQGKRHTEVYTLY
jgi:hypothetical protein